MSQKETARKKFRTLLERVETFFSSWRFPVFTLSVLLFFMLLIVVISLIPVGESGIGAFAEDFKTWCLGYDPATGEIESIYLVMFIVQPIILSLFVIVFWMGPLSDLFGTRPWKALPAILAGLAPVLLVAAAFPALYAPAERGELPFPAEEIRTRLTPPSFSFINQDSTEISMDDLRNDVVMITAVYASCADTCPIILEQARRVLNNLKREEAARVHLLAITLNPERDTPGMLKMVADHYGLNGPNEHLLTGDPDRINKVLDQLNISRKHGDNGRIDHANLFLLVDKAGFLAYRFTIGNRQEQWLLKATRLLVNEPEPGPALYREAIYNEQY